MTGPPKNNEGPQDDPLERLLAEAGITMEELMAYADGVLAPDRRAAVRAALEKHPDLMELLEIFLFTKGAFVRPYDELLSKTVPAKLVDAARGRRRRTIWDWLRLMLSPDPAYRTPVFAVAALAAVLVTAWLLTYVLPYEFVARDRQGLAAFPLLQQALETTPSGTTAEIAAPLSVRPKLSFYTKLKIWCRQYELLYGESVRQEAIACRGSDGVWRVWRDVNPVVVVVPSPYGVATDGGLEALRRTIIDGTSLPLLQEKDRINGGWKPRSP